MRWGALRSVVCRAVRCCWVRQVALDSGSDVRGWLWILIVTFAVGLAGIPERIIKRASDVLTARKSGEPLVALRSRDSSDLRLEEQLSLFFASISDWANASDSDVEQFLTMARVCDQ